MVSIRLCVSCKKVLGQGVFRCLGGCGSELHDLCKKCDFKSMLECSEDATRSCCIAPEGLLALLKVAYGGK